MARVTPQQAKAQMRAWVRDVVVGLNFCPFARPVVDDGLRYAVEPGFDLRAALHAVAAELQHLDDDPRVETTLLLFPLGFEDFEDFLDLIDYADDLLVDLGYEGTYQLAHFHPDYRFEGAADDDPANYTNRAPVPALHLLREASMEASLESVPHPKKIPERNQRVARELGLNHLRALLKASKTAE